MAQQHSTLLSAAPKEDPVTHITHLKIVSFRRVHDRCTTSVRRLRTPHSQLSRIFYIHHVQRDLFQSYDFGYS
jgi:hypothetical protein